MKTTIFTVALLGAAALATSGCAVRSAEFYRDDVQKLLESKSDDIKSCYDSALASGDTVSGAVQVKFRVAEDSGAIENPSVVGEAPAPLQECVTKSLDGLKLTPADSNPGEGTFTWEFTIGAEKKS